MNKEYALAIIKENINNVNGEPYDMAEAYAVKWTKEHRGAHPVPNYSDVFAGIHAGFRAGVAWARHFEGNCPDAKAAYTNINPNFRRGTECREQDTDG